ncbi:MAG: hypothetical protein CMG50_02785 [Candidatus Marinimicrobia bacterium]|nr:hypothetical protein [Candidatus Neomarinimicrobiota bacterium]
MKNKLIYVLFISFILAQDEIGNNLHSSELINYLNNNYKTNTVLSYNNARDILYSEVDKNLNNNQVKCIYTNYYTTLPNNVDPSTYLYENGMNCEHLWPQSLGAGSSPMKSDMHHLRPCKENANSYRSNKAFGNSPDNSTSNWLWLENNHSYIPSNNIDQYSENNSSVFEPREDVKGDVARSMFYFYTIYTNEADNNFFNTQKDILYQWHLDDPANDEEINRTWLIANYQNNIPNPFILDNTLVYRCYFYDESELGCDGIPNSGLINDECEVCGGNNSTCIDNCGIPNGDNTTCADINNDNTVNVTDVIYLVNLVINQSTSSAGDINNDNTVNITDIVMLVNIILGDNL